jgi:hypothetical protein
VPPEASAGRILASMGLDYLAVGLLTFMALAGLLGLWSAPGAILFGFCYRSLGRSGGRQTFGQAVFHVLTISDSAGPAGLEGAMRRSLLELILSLKLALRGMETVAKLEQATRTLEVTLA